MIGEGEAWEGGGAAEAFHFLVLWEWGDTYGGGGSQLREDKSVKAHTNGKLSALKEGGGIRCFSETDQLAVAFFHDCAGELGIMSGIKDREEREQTVGVAKGAERCAENFCRSVKFRAWGLRDDAHIAL